MAEVGGDQTFFEVKRRTAEDMQTPPQLLVDRLLELNPPYSLVIEMLDVNYDCQNIDAELNALVKHIESMEDADAKTLWWAEDKAAPPFSTPGFRVWFHEKGEKLIVGEFFEPTFPEDIRGWLLEPKVSSKDGKPMKPMVAQAREKGADVLMCRVTPWGPWEELVQTCFGPIQQEGAKTFSAVHPALEHLRGVILFSRYDEFRVVNNRRTQRSLWINDRPRVDSVGANSA